MLAKLKFKIAGQWVTFYAHELVQLAAEEVKNRLQALPNNQSFPDYRGQQQKIEQEFSRVLSNLAAHLAQVKGVDYNLVLEFFQVAAVAPWAIPHFKLLLDRLQPSQYDQPLQLKLGHLMVMPLPWFELSMSSQAGLEPWLRCARAFREQAHLQHHQAAWWVKVAGRIVRVRNDATAEGVPGHNKHLYVSDHGQYEQTVATTAAKISECINLFSWSNNNGTWFHAYKFWRFYTQPELQDDQKITKHQQLLRQEFKAFMADYSIDPGEQKQQFAALLFLSTNTVKSNPDIRLNLQQYPSAWSVGSRGVILESVLRGGAHESVDHVDADPSDRLFDDWVETFRYVTEAILQQRCEFFNAGLNPFHTQLTNYLSAADASAVIFAQTLVALAKKINRGQHEPLFRTHLEFGNRDSGATYQEFEYHIGDYFANHDDDDVGLVRKMRQILMGQRFESESLAFLPCLTAAWFIAETSRNFVTALTSLMLLDLIEVRATSGFPDGSPYGFCNSLIHPNKRHEMQGKSNKVKNSYDQNLDLDKIGGLHPMTHTGSFYETNPTPKKTNDESKSDSKANKIQQGHDITQNISMKLTTVRQKEGRLIIDWLLRRIMALPSKTKTALQIEEVAAEPLSPIEQRQIKGCNQELLSKSWHKLDQTLPKTKKKLQKIQQTIQAKRAKTPPEDATKYIAKAAKQQAVITLHALKQPLVALIRKLFEVRLATCQCLLPVSASGVSVTSGAAAQNLTAVSTLQPPAIETPRGPVNQAHSCC